MAFNKEEKFREYLHKCDDPYLLIRLTVKEARRREKALNYRIMSSEALTWVVQGKVPNGVRQQLNGVYITTYENRHMKELLCYVDDPEVRQAVEDSYIASKKNTNLLYKYNSIKEDARQARVRVLTNQLWYTLSE